MNRRKPATTRAARSRNVFRATRFLLAAVCLAALRLPAQQEPTFSTDVNVVNVIATVRNKQGQIISNLTKDDFLLEEDGRPQTIRYFARESGLPLTLGLLVDTSLSQSRVLEQERTASYAFLDQVLREDKDLAFVIHFDKEVELLQDLTSSRQKLQASLDLLRTPEPDAMPPRGGGIPGAWPGSGPGTQPGPWPDPGGRGRTSRRMGGGGTNLYDAVYLASNELMKSQPGRKALILLSDGVDTGSQLTLLNAVEAAQRADTLVYSILFADAEMYRPRVGIGLPGMGGGGRMGGRGGGMGRYPQPELPDGKGVLQRISKETGGRFFAVSGKQTLGDIYDAIQEDLRNQYSLGYSPDRAAAGGSYRRIRLVTKQKGLIVQTREGYYAAH